MNRAILIVICDFLVSAMLAMMTGMVPAHTGGTGVGLDEQTTRALLTEMHENLSQLEHMRELLREVVRKNGGATPEQERQLQELARQIIALRRDAELLRKGQEGKEFAKLTAKELRQRLELERRERLRAEMEREEHHHDLAERERELRQLRRDFSAASQAIAAQTKTAAELQRDYTEVVASNARLARSNAELTRSNAEANRQLEESRTALRRAEDERGAEKTRRELAEDRLENAEARTREKEREVKRSREELANVLSQNARSRADLERNKILYITAKKDLDRSEKERAKLRDSEERLKRQNEQLKLVNEKQATELRERERLLKISRDDHRREHLRAEEATVKLAAVETRIEEQNKRLKDKDNTIKVTTEQLRLANHKLRNQILRSYGRGAVKLTVDIREELMLGREQRGGGVFYLPLVELGGKTFLVGHLNQFLGELHGGAMSFRKVTRATLAVSVPGAKPAPEQPLLGPVLLSAREPLLAAVPLRLAGRKPMRALTVEELRDRGVDGLFLFKAGSPGNEYAELSKRCSIDISGTLFIRNSGSRSELRAEPGDLVMTRAGEFAGLVAAVDRVTGTRRHGDMVRVFVMPDDKVWDAPKFTIPYSGPAGAKYFTDFENAVLRLREALK